MNYVNKKSNNGRKLFPLSYLYEFDDSKFITGNYGLWYNKYIPVYYDENRGNFIISDKKGKKDNKIEYYKTEYDKNKANIDNLLREKHLSQIYFYKTLEKIGYKALIIWAKLKSPLIIGLGETHPAEVSLTFDHNIGVPYIRASSIKGIVRLAYAIEKINNSDKYDNVKNDEEIEGIKDLFGTTSGRGNIIFMDAYPLSKPELGVDIMNPHYQEYYNSKETIKPPSDNSMPVPLKFLHVKNGTYFIFRTVIDKKIGNDEIYSFLINSYKRALEIEGVGAKTSLGYGRFEVKIGNEPEQIKNWLKEREKEIFEQKRIAQEKLEREKLNNMTEDEKMIYEILKLNKDNEKLTEEIGNIWNKIRNGEYNKEVYLKFKEKLIEVDEWKPKGSKQKKEKMRDRQKEIEEKLNA